MLRIFVIALWTLTIVFKQTHGLSALDRLVAEETKDDYLRDVDADDSVLHQRTREEGGDSHSGRYSISNSLMVV
jgi:hypothetical protein